MWTDMLYHEIETDDAFETNVQNRVLEDECEIQKCDRAGKTKT